MRPFWFHFPADKNSYTIDNAFLLGEFILVHPVTDAGANSVDVYFPGDSSVQWLDIVANEAYNGGQKATVPAPISKNPYFQRSSSIVPKRERVRRSAALTLDDPISLDIVLDGNAQEANGQVYLDDGTTFNYRKKDFIQAEISFKDQSLTYNVVEGSFASSSWLERVTFYRYPSKPTKIELVVDGKSTPLQFKYDSDAKILVIRKPEVRMSNNWHISIN
jgi:alpha 1,3-glucosidase